MQINSAKQVSARRSTVFILPLQLGFPGLCYKTFNGSYKFRSFLIRLQDQLISHFYFQTSLANSVE
jgi:hypothetical protein